ncbi:hypothetical protein BKA70DRAFT_208187 [Coprinopsis sp. MPI-PUGE-AT-0042]|nr:hypothetical protein BKA70DRAFT_208187 [Coprinopsis sp. MPI-PUGE-AT-0042]
MEASITLQTGSKNVSPEFFVRNAFSLAAFVCVLCEYIENLDEEVKLIWKGPMNWVKGLYLTTRYSVLVSFLVNTGLLLFGRMRLYPNDIADCRRWFSLSETVACVPMFAIDALSMIRIYVLYQRSFRIGAFVASLIFAEAILVTTSTSTAMKTLGFTPDCQATDVPLQVLFFGAWVVMTQMALIWFTFHKLKSIAGELHASTVYLVLYQGMWLCFFVVVLIFLTMLCSAIMGTGNPQHHFNLAIRTLLKHPLSRHPKPATRFKTSARYPWRKKPNCRHNSRVGSALPAKEHRTAPGMGPGHSAVASPLHCVPRTQGTTAPPPPRLGAAWTLTPPMGLGPGPGENFGSRCIAIGRWAPGSTGKHLFVTTQLDSIT